MECAICGSISLGPICAMCQLKADPRQIEEALRNARPTGRGQTLVLTEQPASRVEASSLPAIKRNLDERVPAMVTYLESRDYFNCTRETSQGDQHTPSGCEEGTNSLDFQGVRKGSGADYYIDLQAQSGGGSTKRKTYAQVLIQTGVGAVPAETIVRALQQSLQGVAGTKHKPSGVRVVIHAEGAAMPK
jgi:hypothetical protein